MRKISRGKSRVEDDGTLCVPLRIGTSEGSTVTLEDRFVIIDRPSALQAILGKPVISKLKAVVDANRLRVVFPTHLGERTLEGN